MKRKLEAKNDLFYAFVMFAMFAVALLTVAAEFFHRYPEAFFVDFNQAVEPRVMAAEVDALVAATTRMA